MAVMFALSGLAALAFQVTWVRLFGLLFGSSVYSFAGVLAIYLLGLAAGSAIAGPFLSRVPPVTAFAACEIALALIGFATIHLFGWLPEAFFRIAQGGGGSWWALYLGQLRLVAIVVLVPCMLLGAIFPLAARLLQVRDGGRATGEAYAVNTLGTIAGTLIAGFLLVPRLGVQGTQFASAALSAVIGVGLLMIARARHETGALPALAASAAIALGAVTGMRAAPWDPAVMSAGVFRPQEAAVIAARAAGAPQAVHAAKRGEKVLFYREGVNGSVYVLTDSASRYRALRIGGKVDASTGDMDTQVLAGLLPSVTARAGGRAAVIGLGSGATALAVLAGGVKSMEVVEIEPAVVEASRFFVHRGYDPLADPRTVLVLADGRTHVAYARVPYDVIVSEPSNPWIAGVNNLFTVEFYDLVRRRLTAEGVFCSGSRSTSCRPRRCARSSRRSSACSRAATRISCGGTICC